MSLDAIVRIERPGEPMSHLDRSRTGDIVSTDGTPAQTIEVRANWVDHAASPPT
ncbi:MAG TPA: hypothetical protein VK020_01025 [Microlunatus sp.]|nr:hypothetical protein [Microlunatus sp.]